jgi:hypothetical protein
MKLYNNLHRAHGGIVVEDEKKFQCAMVVVDVDDADDGFVIEPVDITKD